MSAREKTLADLRDDVWQAGGWIAAGIIVLGAAALVFIYMAVPSYRAQMIVSPAQPMSGAEVSSVSGEDNFFTAHFMPRKDSEHNALDFLRFENMFSGPGVAAKLLNDEKIKRGLGLDKNFSFSNAPQVWTPESLSEYIAGRVRIEPVGASALRKLVYLHPSREFGVYFLYRLHRVTDEMIRASVRNDSTQRIDYLRDTSGQQLNPEHRRALTALLLEEERLRMLASIDQPYAASVVEPPAASTKPRWPDATLLVPVSMFAGAMIGFVLHGFFVDRRRDPVSFRARRKAWFKAEGTNSNERRLITRKAAE